MPHDDIRLDASPARGDERHVERSRAEAAQARDARLQFVHVDDALEIGVGRCDDPGVDLVRLRVAERGEFALLDHAQQPRLSFGRDRADLVEEDRAVVGDLEQSNPVPLAATKGSWAGFGDIVATAASEGVLELLEKAINRPRP